jgi:hypothetical protein
MGKPKKAKSKRKQSRRSAAMAKRWADPKLRAQMIAAQKQAQSRPEEKARKSAASRKVAADPEFRARKNAAIKKTLSSPEARARMSATSKKVLAYPEVRERYEAGRRRAAEALLRGNTVPDRADAAVMPSPVDTEKRGRPKTPGEETAWFRIGAAVEAKIPKAFRSDLNVIKAARDAVRKEGRYGRGTVANYHKRYRKWLRAGGTGARYEISRR